MPEVIINGPEGRIEARYSHNDEKGAPIALILHPHPEHGGTMNNRIVYTLYREFVNAGFSTLRFNFRGVGKSEGSFDNGEGELGDAAIVLDWLQNKNPYASACWVSGFSFGSWIAMQLLMRRPEISSFIAAAPPVTMYDFNFLAPCPTSGLVISADKDEIVPYKGVVQLASKLTKQRGISVEHKTIKGAGHFFKNHFDEFSGAIANYIESNANTPPGLDI